MNVDKRKHIFNKIKESEIKKKKEVRFKFNPNLERETCLQQDLRLLRNENFEPLVQKDSDVFAESFLSDTERKCQNLNPGEFWKFVYSDGWKGYSSLRIADGHLLDTLLYYLFILTEKENLKGYKVAKFDNIQMPKPHFYSKSKQINRETKNVGVKIRFVLYKLQTSEDNSSFDIKEYIKEKFTKPEHDAGTGYNSCADSVISGQGDFTHSSKCKQNNETLGDEYKPAHSTASNDQSSEMSRILEGSHSAYLPKTQEKELIFSRVHRSADRAESATQKLMPWERPSTPPPEAIHSAISFHTEYYAPKPPPDVKPSEDTLEEVQGKKQRGLPLTDPDEHVIIEDSVSDSKSPSSEHKQMFINKVFGRDSKEVLPSIKPEESVKRQDKKRIQRIVQFKHLPVYLRIIANQKQMREKLPKIDNDIDFDEILEAVSRCNTPFLPNLPESKNTTKGTSPSINTTDKDLYHFSPIKTCYNTIERFQNIDGRGSIPKLKNLRTFNEIRRTARSPSRPTRTEVMSVIEEMIANKHLPRLKPINDNTIKLYPRPYKEPKLSSQESLEMKKQRLEKNEKFEIPPNPFQPKVPDDFVKFFLQACNDFLIRKEQITLSDSWKTTTSVTINRIIPFRYGNVVVGDSTQQC